MGARERISERCRPFLESDEDEIEFAFVARATGYNAYRIVVVTSRQIVVLENKFFGIRPKRVMRTFARRTRIGKLSILGGTTHSLGEPLFIHPRWVPEARRVDAALDELAGRQRSTVSVRLAGRTVATRPARGRSRWRSRGGRGRRRCPARPRRARG